MPTLMGDQGWVNVFQYQFVVDEGQDLLEIALPFTTIFTAMLSPLSLPSVLHSFTI